MSSSGDQRSSSVFWEKQVGEFFCINVIDARQAGFNGAGHVSWKEAHRIERIFRDVISEQLILRFELLIIDHGQYPRDVGIHQIRKFELGIVQIQGHGPCRIRHLISLPAGGEDVCHGRFPSNSVSGQIG